MPELPEVETVCRGLAHLMQGRVLKRVDVRRKNLRIPFPPDLAQRLTGRRVERISRRAKYIIMELDKGPLVVAHLGMSGRMTTVNQGAPLEKHDHVVFHLDNSMEVRFNDPRRFGLMTLVPKNELDAHKLFKGQGPDPITGDFSPEFLAGALKGRKTSIKAALLDQRIVVGLGNIYVSEALFRAGLSPKRKAGTVNLERAQKLVPEIKAVLEEAIKVGGSSLRDHVQPNGELGYFQHNWRVYGREGEPCRNIKTHGRKAGPATIKRIVQGGRSTFFCPRCQK
ncbi:MAG: bifunctional DNA-formamidopyrimidine glycosylase/DNA-(apurinic or apyrimidinic site) lyase [Rhodospirillaceae bacterium]|nr:bifunctional DNA-formamidopyrimidine glycosylase/DNA-(apurinic or apyrimidinic site) lyase [Rhodospirillaceae bacterium]